MAEPVDDAFVPPNTKGAPTKYPWEFWTDGRTWKAVKWEDFDVATEHFVATLHMRAKRDGLKVKTKKDMDQLAVYFRFEKDVDWTKDAEQITYEED